jgi:hypothetical protein
MSVEYAPHHWVSWAPLPELRQSTSHQPSTGQRPWVVGAYELVVGRMPNYTRGGGRSLANTEAMVWAWPTAYLCKGME